MIDLTSKLEESNDIEHNKGSKIYPQNHFILDCIMSSIPLKHKPFSIILICVIVSHISSIFFLLFLIGKIRHGIGGKRWLFSIGNEAEIRPLEMGRKSPDTESHTASAHQKKEMFH